MSDERVYAEELHGIAAGYQDYLKYPRSRGERGRRVVSLLVKALLKYLPDGIRPYDHAFVSGLPNEWDLALSRENLAASSGRKRPLDSGDVLALFEVKAYGIIGKGGQDLGKVERVEEALNDIRLRCLSAKKHCPNLVLLCYFSLQERTPKRPASVPYYALTKRLLEPEVLTIMPFSTEIRPDRPMPAAYPTYIEEWGRLVGILRGLSQQSL